MKNTITKAPIGREMVNKSANFMSNTTTSTTTKVRSTSCDSKMQDSLPKKTSVGRWTEEEHRLFLEGLELFPYRAWKKIATLIETRTVVQIRTHAQKYYQKLAREEEQMQLQQQKHSSGSVSCSASPPTSNCPIPPCTTELNSCGSGDEDGSGVMSSTPSSRKKMNTRGRKRKSKASGRGTKRKSSMDLDYEDDDSQSRSRTHYSQHYNNSHSHSESGSGSVLPTRVGQSCTFGLPCEDLERMSSTSSSTSSTSTTPSSPSLSTSSSSSSTNDALYGMDSGLCIDEEIEHAAERETHTLMSAGAEKVVQNSPEFEMLESLDLESSDSLELESNQCTDDLTFIRMSPLIHDDVEDLSDEESMQWFCTSKEDRIVTHDEREDECDDSHSTARATANVTAKALSSVHSPSCPEDFLETSVRFSFDGESNPKHLSDSNTVPVDKTASNSLNVELETGGLYISWDDQDGLSTPCFSTSGSVPKELLDPEVFVTDFFQEGCPKSKEDASTNTPSSSCSLLSSMHVESDSVTVSLATPNSTVENRQ